MHELTRDHLALILLQNWMAKYPHDTCNNGGTDVDDSLTSLDWLQNLKITSPKPPCGPVPTFGDLKKMKVNPNLILNAACGPPTKMCETRVSSSEAPPLTSTTVDGGSIDYRKTPHVKPPYSYAALISMAMKETKNGKISLSAIYNWITDNFMYYRPDDPSWQNSIRHNLSLNKSFQKVPRAKDEPGKGGLWCINEENIDMTDNGAFKSRRSNADMSPYSSSPPPSMSGVKRIKSEPLDDDDFSNAGLSQPTKIRRLEDGNSVLHFGTSENEQPHLKGDFNLAFILNQDIEIGGVRIKTEDLIDSSSEDEANPILAMTPPTTDSYSVSDFRIDDFLGETDFNSDTPMDLTSCDNLDLSVVGTGNKAPDYWWAESFDLTEQRNVSQNKENITSNGGLNPPEASSPVDNHDEVTRPWFDRDEFETATHFGDDNLFDIGTISSPLIPW